MQYISDVKIKITIRSGLQNRRSVIYWKDEKDEAKFIIVTDPES